MARNSRRYSFSGSGQWPTEDHSEPLPAITDERLLEILRLSSVALEPYANDPLP